MMTLFRMKMSLPSKSTPVCGKSYPQTGQFRNTIGLEWVRNRFNLRQAPCRRAHQPPLPSAHVKGGKTAACSSAVVPIPEIGAVSPLSTFCRFKLGCETSLIASFRKQSVVLSLFSTVEIRPPFLEFYYENEA